MTATMTWVGLDVHARSTHAAAIDRESGELTRARFGAGVRTVVEWLERLPQPVHGCYEAGPTGYALYRATEAAGLRVEVVAPSKTPRAPADRVKTDRKDAELLVRLLLAGSLSVVAVPPASFEAARDLARAREQVRADLARLRHRVSKLLLRYGRVYDGGGTWTQAHRRWLAGQRFEHVADRARLPRRAGRDRRAARPPGGPRRAALAARDRAGALADGRQAALLPRHRDALGARPASRGRRLRPLPPPRPARSLARLVPSLHQSGRERDARLDHQDRLRLRPPHPGRGRLALPARTADRRQPPRPPGRPARPRPPDRLACTASPLPSPPAPPRTRQARQRRCRRRRTRAGLLPLGGSRDRLTPGPSRPR